MDPTTTETAAPMRLRGWRKRTDRPGGLEDCSLIVATYRRPREVAVLLDNVAGLPDPPGELLIVDGSPDGDTEQVASDWAANRRMPFDLVYVRSPAGLTRQRNVGIEASAREILFFLDDDCEPLPGYFEAMRRVFREDSKKEIGASGASIVNEMGLPIPLRWRLRFLLGIVPRGQPRRYYPMATSVPSGLQAPFSGSRIVDMVPGGASAFRRSVFDRHRFSLFFDGYAQGEDLEMSLRVRREWKIVWCGDAHVNHWHAAGGRPGTYSKGQMEVRNRFFIWRRHSPDASLADRCRFWMDIAYIFAYDLGSYLARPLSGCRLALALGIASGAVSCVVRPPRYEEPPVRQAFEFELAESTA